MGEKITVENIMTCEQCSFSNVFSGRTQEETRKGARTVGWKIITSKRGKGGGLFTECPSCVNLHKKHIPKLSKHRNMNLNRLFQKEEV